MFSQERTTISHTITGLQISLCSSPLAVTFNEPVAFLPLSKLTQTVQLLFPYLSGLLTIFGFSSFLSPQTASTACPLF